MTGAAGFVGNALLAELDAAAGPDDTVGEAASDTVTTVDRRALPDGTAPDLRCDLLDPAWRERLRAAFGAADAVVHLAGCPGVRDDRSDVAVRRALDNVGTAELVCALTPLDVPVLVLSSSSVYGGSFGGPSRETDALAPRGGYARSKVEVEAACARRAAAGGAVLVVRPFTLLGAGQRADMAVSLWAEAIRAGRPVSVLGSLARTRDLTCARQAARALRELAVMGATGTVNLGGGRPRTLADLLGAVERAVGARATVRVRPAPPREVSGTWAHTGRLATLLGWVPETDLDDAVARAVAQPALHARRAS